jgi:nucleotide-binding universal stress UspA family protein
MKAPARHIIVGVDGSDASMDALRWALHQAKVTDSTLEAVTSWRYANEYGAEVLGADVNWELLAGKILDETLTKVDANGEKITRTVSQGHPAEVLTDASTNADLLVVGSRGHGGFAAMVLGSVGVHVCAHAHCPVVVVRHQHVDAA